MCLLPLPNHLVRSIAYQKGVTQFDCGVCPECLRKRSNVWALRAVYESREHVHNCMITLTYDNFVRDKDGRIIGETDVNPDLRVSVRDAQLFLKRLRKWYYKKNKSKLRYILCAEYGTRTHRAHYHAILFNVSFSDLVPYKRSKRGNQIYMSDTLNKLWNNGICTVDSTSVRSAIARYCTKYCAKTRSDDTFMLTSQRIGLDGLMRDFNGINYMIDGREYPIPRIVWEEYIMNKYSKYPSIARGMSPRYVNRPVDYAWNLKYPMLELVKYFNQNKLYQRSIKARARYRQVRDMDLVYRRYLDYWQRKGALYERLRPSARDRIMSLSDDKYHFYKIKALQCLDRRQEDNIPYVAPGSGCVSAFNYVKVNNENFMLRLRQVFGRSLARIPSRPNRASDTIYMEFRPKFLEQLAKKKKGCWVQQSFLPYLLT